MPEYLVRRVEAVPYGDMQFPLVGRAESVKWVQSALAQQPSVWITGLAGSGRRSLAAYVARERLAQTGGAVLWLECCHDDLPMLAERIVRAFGAQHTPGALLQTARETLRKQQPLVVLAGKARPGVFTDFLTHCLPENVICLMISTPAQTQTVSTEQALSLGALSQTNTRQLFEAIAAPVTIAEDTAALRALLHYAEGYPFPLVLSARQVATGHVQPAQLAANLPRTPTNPQTRALGMIDAAFKLLDGPTQGVLLVLGAMSVVVTPQFLLQTVIGIKDESRLTNMLMLLHERGFITYDADARRCRVHELMQQYAHKRLAASGADGKTHQRIRKAVLRHVLRATDAPDEANFAVLASITEHILQLIHHSDNPDDQQFLETVLRLLPRYGADGFIESQGYQAYFERLRQLAGISDTPTAQHALVATETTQQSPRPIVDHRDPTQETGVLSVQALENALADAQQSGDQQRIQHLNGVLGDWHTNRYNADTAAGYYATALSMMQPTADREAYLRLLLKLCRAYVESDDPISALQHIGDALQYAPDVPLLHGLLLDVSGDARHALNDQKGALEDFRTAMALLAAHGDQAAAGITMGKAAAIFIDQRNYQEASLLLAQAVDLFEQSGRRGLQGQALGNLGTALGYMRRWREAGRRHMLALQIARDLGDGDEERYQLGNLAFVSETEGYLDWALHYARQALYVSLQINDHNAAAQHAFDVGRLLTQQPTMLLQAIVAFEAALQYDDTPQTRSFLQQARQQLAQVNQSALKPPENILSYARAAYEA